MHKKLKKITKTLTKTEQSKTKFFDKGINQRKKKPAEKLFLHMDSTINVKQTNKKEGDFLILFFVLI